MARDPKPGKWQHQVENLTAYERAERGNAIYTRVLEGKRYGQKQRLCDPIRKADGKIDHAKEAAAIAMAVERQVRIASGVADLNDGPLTLDRGFRLMFSTDGKYAAETDRKTRVKACSIVILEELGADTLCKDVAHLHYQKLWRHLAREHVSSGNYGPVAAEKILGALRTLMAWLQETGRLAINAGFPGEKWKKQMKTEWAQITKKPIPAVQKHRYTPAENVKMWRALPAADPRTEVATQIGAELRQGQVARVMRSNVLPHGGFRIGAVDVPGTERKAGAYVVLTMEQRHVLTRAMTSGYLAEFEAEYQKNGTDYAIIPGGKLRTVKTRRGPRFRANLKYRTRHWERTGMRKAWHRLEQLAEVTHVPNRSWYGMRRLSSDLAEDVESDDRVLNAQGGWTDSGTRRKYQEVGRKDIQERAAVVRSKIRPNVRRNNEIRRDTESGK